MNIVQMLLLQPVHTIKSTKEMFYFSDFKKSYFL